jgi:hypothetical protein
LKVLLVTDSLFQLVTDFKELCLADLKFLLKVRGPLEL